MEKERGKITFTETDEGFRIEVIGKDLKEWFSCCCLPVFKQAGGSKSECCASDEEKK